MPGRMGWRRAIKCDLGCRFLLQCPPRVICCLPRWYEQFGRRWRQPGRLKRGFTIVRIGLRLVWELILPALLLGLPILNGYLTWRTLFFNAPDMVSWLLVIFALLLITAIIRLVLIVLALIAVHRRSEGSAEQSVPAQRN